MAEDAEYETLRKELDQLRSDIGSLSRTLKDIATDQGSAAYEKVKQSAQRAQTQATEAIGAVGSEIGERPFTSMFTAFGIGLVIGMLFSRRS
jgi:ElaB/YqjD/DUF883 family membrane-anchored ribosome-binding protein